MFDFINANGGGGAPTSISAETKGEEEVENHPIRGCQVAAHYYFWKEGAEIFICSDFMKSFWITTHNL